VLAQNISGPTVHVISRKSGHPDPGKFSNNSLSHEYSSVYTNNIIGTNK